jgi:phenylacetate-CoA ligase
LDDALTSSSSLSELTLPRILYQPRDAVRALQDRLLEWIIELCYLGHPYYRRTMRRLGLEPVDIRTTTDLQKLPITSKADFMAQPDDFRLAIPELPVEERVLWEVMYTTGTSSGQPAPIYTTTWDHFAYLYHAAQCCDLAGINKTDVIGNALPLTPYPMGVYVRAQSTAAAIGAAIVTANTGRRHPSFPVHRSVDEAIRLFELHRVTVLWGIASFVRRMLLRALDLRADLSSVRICSISGEGTSMEMRREMLELLGQLGAKEPRILNRYGSTEIGSLLECAEGSGWHNPTPEQTFLEVADPDTGARLGNGETGLLLATHLIRRGTVLIRYEVGDIVAMSDEVCPHCGRTSERVVSQPVRTKELTKVKGMLVNLKVLTQELDSTNGLDEYQVIIQHSDPGDPFSMDELMVRAVISRDEDEERVFKEISRRTVTAAQVRPRIVRVAAADIFDPQTETKFQRIVDKRPSTR